MDKIYSKAHFSIIDKIILKKRKEMINLINYFISGQTINSVLDVGTTEVDLKSSNYIIKNMNLNDKTIKKSISIDNIKDPFFNNFLKKSISEEFNSSEHENFLSDLTISNATIEHVGCSNNQKKMIENMIKFSKKYFIIITPNRFHPIEFHTKLPFIHWLPKKLHRIILKKLKFDQLCKEENLNLLSFREIRGFLSSFKNINYKLKCINLFGFKSNIIILGTKT